MRGLTVPVTAPARMLRKMTPSEQDPPAVAAAEPPRAGGQVVVVAVALLEAAALLAAMRRVAGLEPAPAPVHGGRSDVDSISKRGRKGLADRPEHARGRCAPGGAGRRGHNRPLLGRGWVSQRPELSVDLRHAAAWLAAGARFGP